MRYHATRLNVFSYVQCQSRLSLSISRSQLSQIQRQCPTFQISMVCKNERQTMKNHIASILVVLCSFISTTMEASTVTTEIPFVCPATDGSYPISGTCSSEYFDCIGGVTFLQTCPDDEVFDPVALVCTPSAEASCNQPFDCPADGPYPYPDGCASFYYVCVLGQSSVVFCPENFVFDPVTSKCETIENASCTPGPYTTTPTTTTPTTTRLPNTCGEFTTTYTFVCPGNGPYPYDDCSSLYWQCSNNYPYLQCCPSYLVFNPALYTCDYESNVAGCNSMKYDVVNHDQLQIQGKMEVDSKDILIGIDTDFQCPSYGTHPHPLYCDWYYTCYNQEPAYLWECRGDLLFQSSDGKCNYPELTDCVDRIRPNSTAEAVVETFKCQTDGFFSVGVDKCSSTYVTCIDGVAYYKECPANGVFDGTSQICTQAHLLPVA